MKCFILNLSLVAMSALAEQKGMLDKTQAGNGAELESQAGMDALFGSEQEQESFDQRQQGPTMHLLDDMLQREKLALKQTESTMESAYQKEKQLHKVEAGAKGKGKAKVQLSERERQSLMMEERLRTTMKAKVRAMVERIGEDERQILKGDKIREVLKPHEVDMAQEMVLPAMGEPGGMPMNMSGDPHWDPDCAVIFFHGLGHPRKSTAIEDVFFKTDAIRFQKPVSKITKRCDPKDPKFHMCNQEYEPMGEVDRCIVLLPDAPVTKHSANGDEHITSWFNQPQLGHGADFLPPAHGVDFNEVNRHTPKIHSIIDDLIENYKFVGERIFLAGFSQGATVAAAAALSYPHRLGGLGMFSGMLLGKENLKKMSHQANREIPISWGYSLDDDVFLPSLHDEGTALLSSAGFRVRSHKYPGLHYMTQKAFDSLEALIQKRLRYIDYTEWIEDHFPEQFEELVPGFQH